MHPHHHNKDHSDTHPHAHGHAHGVIDPSITTHDRGIWAITWSFVILLFTSLLQIFVFFMSNSVALLADAIHNVGDAATAIPLAIAFQLGKLKPTRRFTYGYGRVEDLAGFFVVLMVTLSSIVAGYEAVQRFFHPAHVTNVNAVMAAAVIAFIGNETVAVFRIKVGKEIHSAALIADGYHARMDGFVSLAVLAGAIGIKLGYPLADPLAGLLITVVLVKIVWDSAKTVFLRFLDGIEPEVVPELRASAHKVAGVLAIAEVRARWIGHRVHAELNVAVDPHLSVEDGHRIALAVRQQIARDLPHLSNAVIHIDPAHTSGEGHH